MVSACPWRFVCLSLFLSRSLAGSREGARGRGGAGQGIAGDGFLAHVPSLARCPTAIHILFQKTEILFILQDWSSGFVIVLCWEMSAGDRFRD